MEKERKEKELKASTAAKLKEHRCPQQGERLEYQVWRIGSDCGQPSPTDEEIRETLRTDPRASGTVYGTHFSIRFTHKQMVPAAVLLAHATAETAQARYGSAITLLRTVLLPRPRPCLPRASWVFPGKGFPSCSGYPSPGLEKCKDSAGWRAGQLII